jgi:hypothetical protein
VKVIYRNEVVNSVPTWMKSSSEVNTASSHDCSEIVNGGGQPMYEGRGLLLHGPFNTDTLPKLGHEF